MNRIAIRDDDTSYWSEIDILERTVGKLWRAGAPVSLAIVPNAVRFEAPWDRARFAQGGERKALGENTELADYLRELIRARRITPMLHGIDHRYAFRNRSGSVDIPIGRISAHPAFGQRKLLGEFAWKRAGAIERELKEWLRYLNDLLDYQIKIFVPPSNAISRENARVVYGLELDICGAIATRSFNRPASGAAVMNYVTNAAWRVLFGAHYPGALKYGSRTDRPAHAAPTSQSLKALEARYADTRHTHDLIIATHWYDYERCPSLADDILDLIRRSGRTPAPVEATFAA